MLRPFRYSVGLRSALFSARRCLRDRDVARSTDNLAPLHHRIALSAGASRDGGTSRPSTFAVLRLIMSSYLVGACTGMSAGFSPLRMRSTYPAARRTGSCVLGPYEIRPPSRAQ